MSSRERSIGQYLKGVAGRAIGISYYREGAQAVRVGEGIGAEPGLSPREQGFFLAVMLTMFPIAARARMIEDKTVNPSVLGRGIKWLGCGIDSAPLLAAVATGSPIFLLGKPLLNAVTHLAADAIEAIIFGNANLPHAPEGTYAYLEEVAQKFHDPISKMGVINDSKGWVVAVISKEEICQRTGGSCMNLILVKEHGRETWDKAAHITQRNRIADEVSLFLH